MSTLFRRKGSPFVWISFADQWGRRHRVSTKIRYEVRSGRLIIPHEAREIQRDIDSKVSMRIFDMVPRVKSVKLSTVLDSYLGSAGSNLRPNSKRSKQIAVRELIKFVGEDAPVASIGRDTLFAWKAALLDKPTLSPHTVASWIREVSPLFSWALSEGLIDRSPIVRGLKLNPPVHPPAIYSDRDFSQILAAAVSKPHLHNALRFLWETGFRVGEMTELRWERPATAREYWGYLDFPGNTIWVWNQKERRFDAYPMKGVRDMLEGLRKGSSALGDWVFPAAQGGKLDPARFSRELKAITRGLGLSAGLTVHSIRKSYCSRLIREGVDLGTVQKLMRHRDPATTMRYYAQFGLSTLEAGQFKGSTTGTKMSHSMIDDSKSA